MSSILRRYNDYLTEDERLFLTLLSDNFRQPLRESDLSRLFHNKAGSLKSQDEDKSNISTISLKEETIEAIINHLVIYRILRYDDQLRCYTTHPLIRAYYLTQWAELLYSTGFGDYWELVNRCREASCILFVLEKSWSMIALSKFQTARALIIALMADVWQKGIRVGLVTMHRNKADLVLSPTDDIEHINNALDQKSFEGNFGGKTPIAIGLVMAHNILLRETELYPESEPMIILITDGASNILLSQSDYGPELHLLVHSVIERVESATTKTATPSEEARAAAQLIHEAGFHSIVIDAEIPVFTRGLSKKLAEALRGDFYVLENVTVGWYKSDEEPLETPTLIIDKEYQNLSWGLPLLDVLTSTLGRK